MSRKRSLGLWYRFYVCALDDPKIEQLSDAVFRTWVKLNSVATIYGGIIPSEFSVLTVKLRKPEGKIRDHLQVLLSAGLIDRCGKDFTPHDWEEWQFDSDVSTGRVRAFRDRQRNADETEMKRFITDAKPDLERPHSTESELETEEESISAVPASTRIPKNLLNGHTKDFTEFYAAYPKHVAKGAAMKAYAKALARASPAVILEGAQHYARNRKGEDPAYTKNPATWLNADCWLDEAPITDANQPDPELLRLQEAEAKHRRETGFE